MLMGTDTPGKCKCGCGQDTARYTRNRPESGGIKGEFRPFVDGHWRRNAENVRLLDEGRRRCSSCRRVKTLEDFTAHQGFGGRHSTCKQCQKERRVSVLYGVSLPRARELLSASECDICGCSGNLVIDHCHSAGEVRGVLCSNCNVALGFLKDDVLLLKSAIRYIGGKRA